MVVEMLTLCYLRINYMISRNKVINTSTFYTPPVQYNPNITVNQFNPSQSMLQYPNSGKVYP